MQPKENNVEVRASMKKKNETGKRELKLKFAQNDY